MSEEILDEKMMEEYRSYMRLRTYNNIKNTYRKMIRLVPLFIMMVLIMMDKYSVGIFLIVVLMTLTIRISIYFLDNKIIENLEDNIGCFIYLAANLIRIGFDLRQLKSEEQLITVMPWIMCQLNNFLALTYFTNCKKAIFIEVCHKIVYLISKKYVYNIMKPNEIVDHFYCTLFFSLFIYLAEQINLRLYSSCTKNLRQTIFELTLGMDKVAENLMVVSCDSNSKLSLYHTSENLISSYFKDKNEVSIDTICKKLYPIIGDEKDLVHDSVEIDYSNNLMWHLEDFYAENKQFATSLNTKNMIYALRSNHKTMKTTYFEVKFVMNSFKVFLGHEVFIFMLFKKIDIGKCYIDDIVPSTKDKVLKSSIQELKDSVSSAFSHLYLIDKENNEFMQKVENFGENSQFFENKKSSSNLVSNKINNSPLNLVNNIFTKLVTSDVLLNNNIEVCKYFELKTNLIFENIEMYLKMKQYKILSIRLSDYNLYFLLKKSLNILESMSNFNGNVINLDAMISEFCFIKTDMDIFKKLVQNISLLFDKKGKNFTIDIRVEMIKKTKAPSYESDSHSNSYFLQISFCLVFIDRYINFNHSDEAEKNINYLLSSNNKTLAGLINCEYSEFCSSENGLFLINLNLFDFCTTYNQKVKKGSDTDLLNLADLGIEDINMMSRKHSNDSLSETVQKSICFEGSDQYVSRILGKPTRSKFLSSNMNMQGMLNNSNPIEDIRSQILEYIGNSSDQDSPRSCESFSNAVENNPSISKDAINIIALVEDCPLNASNDACICFNLLIVDDDNLCRNYLTNVAKGRNLKIEQASNGQEAVEKVQELIKNPCLKCEERQLIVLMDIHMPLMNGVEAAKIIDNLLKDYPTMICKTYFISGNCDTQYSKEINEISTFREFYTKPVSKKQILAIIDEVF